MRQALVVREHHAQAHVRRQRRQRGIEVHARRRAVVLGREIREVDVAQLYIAQIYMADRGELPASDFLQPHVHHDSLQPAVECHGTAQSLERAPGREEDLLRQVVTEGRVPAQVIHEFANARLPPAQQLAKGAVITGARQCDHQSVGRLLQVGDRETALHLAGGGSAKRDEKKKPRPTTARPAEMARPPYHQSRTCPNTFPSPAASRKNVANPAATNSMIEPLTRRKRYPNPGLLESGSGSLKSSFNLASSIAPVFSTIRRSVSCFS